MASILERYGIKEVADVTFYELDANGNPGAPVLYLDTLKVSTIEETAENVSARGGKGNPELVTWDYGREITLTLEDALFSAKSMAFMYGAIDANGKPVVGSAMPTGDFIRKTISTADVVGTPATAQIKFNFAGTEVTATTVTYYSESGASVTGASVTNLANWAYAVVDMSSAGTGGVSDICTIDITPNTFPGTYYITGDTYARSEVNGKDNIFQFVIPKAKVLSGNTITMEADGDPSTFSMSVKVLRPKKTSSGKSEMIKLIKYSL